VIAGLALGFLALLSGPRAFAQTPPPPWMQPGQPGQPGYPGYPGYGAPSSTAPAAAPVTAAPAAALGTPLALDNGPWVLGEVLFFSGGKLASDYAWRDRVRGKRGTLYYRSDILSDVDNLMALGKFDKVTPALYEIPNTPVPPEFATIAVSTSQVRLVFDVVEKVTTSTGPPKFVAPPAPVSGMMMTPTAWRGAGRYTTPGLGLDFNGMYIIGRLYGKNDFANSVHHTNYIDRVGVWMLGADGKMQLQSETAIRPAFAVGGQGTFLFRDSGNQVVNTNQAQAPNVTVNASQKTTRLLSDVYFVFSKKLGPVRTSGGVMQGNMGDAVAEFSEFLSPDSLTFLAGQPGGTVRSRTMPFFSLFGLPKPSQPLGVEFIKFNGAALNPWMLNFKIGYFLHATFDLAYLKFQKGYDLLGVLQFRFNQFPRR
jgi:hypothetical protein